MIRGFVQKQFRVAGHPGIETKSFIWLTVLTCFIKETTKAT